MLKRISAALLVAALAGCSGGGNEAQQGNAAVSVRLSETDRDANAPAVAAFFNRTCLQAGETAGGLSGALEGSGWLNDQVQAASMAMPIAGWRLEHGELVHSAMSVGAGSKFVDCELVLDADVSPALARMREAVRPLLPRVAIRETSAGPPEARWEWQAGLRDERVLTIGPGRQEGRNRPVGLSLHLRITEITPREAPPPPELNEIGIEAANVQ